jgi:hypothetical protein
MSYDFAKRAFVTKIGRESSGVKAVIVEFFSYR